VPGTLTVTIASRVLERNLRLSIVTSVPATSLAGVVYLLHGAGTDETQWTAIGLSNVLAHGGTANEPVPIAVVIPDLPATYDVALDSRALTDDVLPAVEACLGRSYDRARRAVGGISRGGELALAAAAAHPELFLAVGGHSPVPPGDQHGTATQLAAGDVAVWLDVGVHDTLHPSVAQFGDTLTAAGTSAELHVWPGAHDRTYWAEHLPDYLHWYGNEFAG
jgi:enterochelin esterase-like enzyme